MPDIPNLTELGFGLGSLALIWVVVRYFIDTVNKKDTQISTMVDAFNKTVSNHMKHETKAFNNLARETKTSNTSLVKAISTLTKKIDKK